MALTQRDIRFVEEYLVDLNATKAYLRAGYDVSESVASTNGWRKLQDAEIQAEVARRMEERSKRTEITQDMVLRELAVLGFSDLTEFATWGEGGVTIRPSADLDPVKRRAIVEVSRDKYGTIKIKLADKKGALDSIGKHLGMFTERVDLTNRIVIERSYGAPAAAPDPPQED